MDHYAGVGVCPWKRRAFVSSTAPGKSRGRRGSPLHWSMQEIRRIATRLARKRIRPQRAIAWPLWRRAPIKPRQGAPITNRNCNAKPYPASLRLIWKRLPVYHYFGGLSFAALRIRISDGESQRILDKGQQHMPGEEAWPMGEWRSSGERKYYLSSLPAETGLGRLAAAIKSR